MKELSTEDKAKRYDEVVAMAKECITHIPDEAVKKYMLDMFPELKENEDERIRKDIIYFLSRNTFQFGEDIDKYKSWIAWLEKQGEKLPVGFYYVNSEGKKFYSDTFKYGNVTLHVEKQGEKDKPTYSTYSKDVQLTQEEYDKRRVSDEATIKEVEAYKEGLEDAQKIFEKQGQVKESAISQHENQTCKENDNSLTRGKSALEAIKGEKADNDIKIKPKFKVGQLIINSEDTVAYINDVKKDIYGTLRYYIEFTTGTKSDPMPCFIDPEYHLWTIADAKAGDALDANGAPFIYKKHDKDSVYFYCGVNLADEFIVANGNDTWNTNYKVYPATKAQRDLLFSKMKEAGYTWDEKKLELKKMIE